MRYYPLFLDIAGKACVVVGGGAVAERKVSSLLKAGARVTVISPRLTKGLSSMVRSGSVSHLGRNYRAGDLDGAALVVSASGSRAVNARVAGDAEANGVPVNVVDDPALSTFIVPSMVARGPLTFAVSTSGECPAYARTLREALDNTVGDEYATFVEILGAVRRVLLKSGVKGVKKDKMLEAVINSPLPEWIRDGKRSKVNGFLKELLGDGFTLSRLGVRLQRR